MNTTERHFERIAEKEELIELIKIKEVQLDELSMQLIEIGEDIFNNCGTHLIDNWYKLSEVAIRLEGDILRLKHNLKIKYGDLR